MKFKDIKFGKLYSFLDGPCWCFNKADTSDFQEQFIPRNTAFIILSTAITPPEYQCKGWETFKILDSNGQIWYFEADEKKLKHMIEHKPHEEC